MVRATFGACHDCGDCNSCRVLGMVRMGWDVGVRSGAAGAREREQQPTFDDWDWDSAHGSLMKYVRNKHFGDDVVEAQVFVVEQREKAQLWATSRTSVQRRQDWTSFLKLWMGQEIAKLTPLPNPQTDLFTPATTQSMSSGDSRSLRLQASRSAGAMRLLNGGKNKP
jgi:hypothetical protein